MHKIKSFDLGSIALYSFLMYLILGLIIFLPIGFIMTLVSSFIPSDPTFDFSVLPFFSGIFLILIPIFYSIFGTMINLVIALIYNLLSKKLGGLKIELVES